MRTIMKLNLLLGHSRSNGFKLKKGDLDWIFGRNSSLRG